MSYDSALSTLSITKNGPDMKKSIRELINVHDARMVDMIQRLRKLQEEVDKNG